MAIKATPKSSLHSFDPIYYKPLIILFLTSTCFHNWDTLWPWKGETGLRKSASGGSLLSWCFAPPITAAPAQEPGTRPAERSPETHFQGHKQVGFSLPRSLKVKLDRLVYKFYLCFLMFPVHFKEPPPHNNHFPMQVPPRVAKLCQSRSSTRNILHSVSWRSQNVSGKTEAVRICCYSKRAEG